MEKKIKSINDYSKAHAMNAIAFDSTEIKDNGDSYLVSGYVCHFGVVNENLEMVTKDSFDKFFEKLNANGIPPKINVQHMSDEKHIIGKWLKLTPRTKGLWGEGVIIKNAYTEEIVKKIKFGLLDNFSTEGYVTSGKWIVTDEGTGEGYFKATNFELLRVSLVDMPADMQAKAKLKENAITFELKDQKNEEPKEEAFDVVNAIKSMFKS